MDKGSTVTGEYYANLMHRFRDSIKVERRGKLTQGGVRFEQSKRADLFYGAR
jgi:hypothetical protein